MKILIIEDEQRLAAHMHEALLGAGHETCLADSLLAARKCVDVFKPELVLLDLGLPDGDGLDLLAAIKSGTEATPVIILSARDSVEDRIKGLDLGADDYLPKPFILDELLARVRSLVRRCAPRRASLLSWRDIQVDLLTRRVTKAGQTVLLTTREFSLLELFLCNPGRVLSRSYIAEKVWDVRYDMQTNLIEVYVRRLRQKLETPGEAALVQTRRGVGYILGNAQEGDNP